MPKLSILLLTEEHGIFLKLIKVLEIEGPSSNKQGTMTNPKKMDLTRMIAPYFHFFLLQSAQCCQLDPTPLFSNGTITTVNSNRIKAGRERRYFALNWTSIQVNPFSLDKPTKLLS